MRDKIIESIFFQFTLNLLNNSNSKNNNSEGFKNHKWIWGGMCMDRGKFLKE